ncbi:MAG: 1,4-dihydroxy-6-naphthoate synthase [Bacteroidales bacterium]|jgi:1,4-dihydroxy-6-naphthoate synthase|nr:1,4-dihydroxy-6-naphthoate synthase [Bacteroidales bacterium]
MNKIKIGFSTCPNDTFMFDALVNKKIDTKGLVFDITLADIEELNNLALQGKLDIIKTSFHNYAYISDKYVLLDSGSALGKNNGPILISKYKIYPDEINDLHIAIPGKNTTANLLLSIAYPDVKKKTEYLFSDIEDVVNSKEVDAGLIIHENRFTYKEKGLKKIIDFGEYWEENIQYPIPLGGIVIKRAFNRELQLTINQLLRESIEFAFSHKASSEKFIKKYAQEISDEVIQKHIDLYVNSYSINLGTKGRDAIKILYDKAYSLGIIPKMNEQIFLT